LEYLYTRVSMARKDFTYLKITVDMFMALETIYKKEGKKYHIKDKTELARIILRQFIAYYQDDRFHRASESIRSPFEKIMEDEKKREEKKKKEHLLI
jgi:hypothetical protein